MPKPESKQKGFKNRVKTSTKKDAKQNGKKMNFRTPEGPHQSTPAASPMQVICMRRKTTQKKESKKNKRTLQPKDPRLGPCGPERIL